MFTKKSFAILYGLQLWTAQHMLDFDFLSWREPSVLGFINPWKSRGIHKLFYWDKELLIPSFPDYNSVPEEIIIQLDTLVNFASFRSAHESTLEAMDKKWFKNIVIIAEWIPERQTLEIIEKNKELGLNIIWPATVWAMSAWVFRAWNTWWSLDNIIDSHLYEAGNVWFVSKSWGMSNELRRVISDRTNWTGLSIALWWDKYNVMNFQDAIKIMESDDSVKMIVMLWEIWWRDELEIAKMISNKEITKPVVSWCIWTINEQISREVQFWHAGAKSNQEEETASYKNKLLAESGAIVPDSYIDLWDKIEETFKKLDIKTSDKIDIKDKIKTINNRTKTSFTSTISDERWEEPLYNGKKISTFTDSPDIGEIIGQLWLKRDLPKYAKEFINTVIVLIADHWPAVSWTANTIVTSRAWNDIKSSLISWLATIWPKFGWAIDWAWNYWLESVEKNILPKDFINSMKQLWINIPWIGHKVKSRFNPDKRCSILDELSKKFPVTRHLEFAKSVEALTLEKKLNLILNVDWYIAAMLLDIFEDLGMDYEEKKIYVDAWVFNWLFLLARSIGFIWHAIDQKRLWESLYRTSWDDILYTN